VAAAAWERAALLSAEPGTRAACYVEAAEAALRGGDADRARRLASNSPAARQPRWRARMLAVKGRLDVAAGKMTAAQQALRAATGQQFLVCDVLVTLASVEAAQGRSEDCLRHVHEADRLASDLGLHLQQLLARRQRALLELGTGRLEEAIEHYEALRRLAARWDISHPYYSPIADLIEAYARAGALDEARRLLPEYLAQVPGDANPLPAARAARCQGIVAAEDYDVHFQKAVSLQERSVHAFQHARTLLCYGERLRRARRRRDARIQLRAAIEIFDRLDARPWAIRARAEMNASQLRTAHHGSGPGIGSRP
jgi:tetratricopeptide (TPR) repeat protein